MKSLLKHEKRFHVVRLALSCCLSVFSMGAVTAGHATNFSELLNEQAAVQSLTSGDLGAAIPINSNPLASGYADLSGLVGGQLYIGQGLNVDSLSAGASSGLQFMVVADAASETAADAAGNAQLLMSSHSRLLQGTTPALGTLSESDMRFVTLPVPALHDGGRYTVTIRRMHDGEHYLAAELRTNEAVLVANRVTHCPAVLAAVPVVKARHVAAKPSLALAAIKAHQLSVRGRVQGEALQRASSYLMRPSHMQKARPAYFHYAIYVTPEPADKVRRAH